MLNKVLKIFAVGMLFCLSIMVFFPSLSAATTAISTFNPSLPAATSTESNSLAYWFQAVMLAMVPAFLGAMAAISHRLVALITGYLKEHFSERFNFGKAFDMLGMFDKVLNSCIEANEVTLKKEWAAAYADGKITDDEYKSLKASLKNTTINTAKNILGSNGLDLVKGVIGDIDKYAEKQLEVFLANVKKKYLTTSPTTQPQPQVQN